MLQNVDEFKAAEGIPAMLNEVDNPNLMSVDSTERIPTVVDEVPNEETKEEAAPVIKEEKKGEPVVPKVEKKADGEEIPPTKGTDKVEKRIGELTKKWRTTERERDFERTKRLEAEAKLKEVSAKIPSEDKPRKEDFDDEADFIEALTDWKIEAKLKTSREEVAATVEGEGEKVAVEKVYDELDAVLAKGRGKHDDFIDLVQNEDLILSPETVEMVMLSDSPEDVLYYLATHPDESAELSTLSPAKVAVRIGVISAKLETPPKTEEKPVVKEKPPVKKQSNAPEPIVPVRTEGLTERDPSKMTPKEYRAWRESNKE
jgi:hypothetical protein